MYFFNRTGLSFWLENNKMAINTDAMKQDMENGANRDLNESFNRQNFVKVGCVGNELSNTNEIIQYPVKMQ